MASELVKFLMTNTAYDSIDCLEKQFSQLADIQKAVKEAVSSATTSSNKVAPLQSHQPSGRRWFREFPLPSSLLPLRGGVYPSP